MGRPDPCRPVDRRALGCGVRVRCSLAMRGRRDFASMQALVADRYEVVVVDAEAEQARQLLSQSR